MRAAVCALGEPGARGQQPCTGGCAQYAVWSQDSDPSSAGCLAGLLTSADWFPFQMEHLKACAEIAAQRTVNWQKFCIKDDCKQRSSFGLLLLRRPFEN